jgi:hypothetical protein
MASLTQDLLQELFNYKDGQLLWKDDRANGKMKAGSRAGTQSAVYRQVSISGKGHLEHRLIYQICHGTLDDSLEIDHIDGDVSNNRIENLRMVSTRENQWNRHKSLGYSFNKAMGKFKASIKMYGISRHLGYFTKESDARRVYLTAVQERG